MTTGGPRDFDRLKGLLRQALALEAGPTGPGDEVELSSGWREAANAHAVVPLLARHPSLLGLVEAEQEWLEETRAAHAFVSLECAAQTGQVHRMLTDAGIPALNLKGATLALRSTGRHDGRWYGDIDVLVEVEDLAETDHILRSAGYVPEEPTSTPVSGRHRRWAEVVGHHATYDHERSLPVEVHWRLTTRGLLDIPFHDLWRDRRTFDIGGIEVPSLGDLHEVLYVAVHGALHGFYRLGWAVDVARLIRPLDQAAREAVVAEARRLGIERPLAVAVAVASELAPTELPFRLSRREEALVQKLTAHCWRHMPVTTPVDAGRWSRFVARLALRPGAVYRAVTVAEAAAPLWRLEGFGELEPSSFAGSVVKALRGGVRPPAD